MMPILRNDGDTGQLSVSTDTLVKIFSRLLVNGELYYSQEFTRVVKGVSFTVLLRTGHIITVYYCSRATSWQKMFCFWKKVW